MEDVKAGRSYVSPARTQQAAATRAAILRAARGLFVSQGYGVTTVDQIAERAGVSKPTVFTAVGNKRAVLSAVRDVAMAGDDAPRSIAEREPAQRVRAEPDVRVAIGLLVEVITDIAARYSDVDEVLRGAAGTDPALRELWDTSEQQRMTGARLWAGMLAEKSALRVDIDTAADILWLYMSVDVYHRMVRQRGWSPERYRDWLAETLVRSLVA